MGSLLAVRDTSEPVDLRGVATECLEREITTFASHLTAAMCRWLVLSRSMIVGARTMRTVVAGGDAEATVNDTITI